RGEGLAGSEPDHVVAAAAEHLRESELVHVGSERDDRYERVPHLRAHLQASALQAAAAAIEQERVGFIPFCPRQRFAYRIDRVELEPGGAARGRKPSGGCRRKPPYCQRRTHAAHRAIETAAPGAGITRCRERCSDDPLERGLRASHEARATMAQVSRLSGTSALGGLEVALATSRATGRRSGPVGVDELVTRDEGLRAGDAPLPGVG